MGKHDKTVFRWDVPKDAFDIAENQKLRAENEKLKERVAELEAQVEKNEKGFDFFKESFKAYRQGTTKAHANEIEELIKDHMDEVHELESQIEKLKEAIVIAAVREVRA